MEAPVTFNDIVLPAAPMVLRPSEQAPVLWLVLALAAFLFLTWWYGRRWWRLRGVTRLTRDWHNRIYDNRDIVFLLAADLRRKLRLVQITSEPPPGLAARLLTRWQSFSRRLDRVRYEGGEVASEELAALLAEARYWLLHVRPAERKKC